MAEFGTFALLLALVVTAYSLFAGLLALKQEVARILAEIAALQNGSSDTALAR